MHHAADSITKQNILMQFHACKMFKVLHGGCDPSTQTEVSTFLLDFRLLQHHFCVINASVIAE